MAESKLRSEVAARAEWVAAQARPLSGGREDWDALIDQIGSARVVLLGEASHGTHDFYAARARLTQRLIAEQGFRLVAIEGDWPDAYQVNRYVRGGAGTAIEALAGFQRFPVWMWRNAVVLDFITWLRVHNMQRPEAERAGFYGLDVYSLHASISEVLRHLRRVDPAAAEVARLRYECLEPFRADTQQYALSAHFLERSCEEEVLANLLELRQRRAAYAALSSREAQFEAEINALAARDAERYYRLMIHGGAITWNLRDRHMVEVLERLRAHLGGDAKVILWEHNTHIGDFRATSEGRGGYFNVGQLLRERLGEQVFAVGFGTHRGTVTAASAWDAPAEFKRVPPAREGSYEAVFHQAGIPRFYLPLSRFSGEDPDARWLHQLHPERAIGVVYDPDHERYGNYVPSRLAQRYDAYVFIDESLAIEPLDPGPEAPGLEAYPSGL